MHKVGMELASIRFDSHDPARDSGGNRMEASSIPTRRDRYYLDENAFLEDLHTKLAACDTAVARLDERIGSVGDQAQGDDA